MTWDYDDKNYQKQATAEPQWLLQRMLTGEGLKGRKIDRELLIKYLSAIKLPENRRVFLELLLWDKKF